MEEQNHHENERENENELVNNEESAVDSHVHSFVKSVKEYVDLDDQIKEAQKDIKLLKARKDNLSLAIMGFMQSQEWEVCNISTGGKLMLKKSKTKGGVKKDTSNSKLVEHFKDNNEIMKHLPTIMKMIFDEREVNEKDVLRRSTPRNK